MWFTGIPGAGKSTIANLLEKRLLAAGKHTYVLDGDNIRHGLSSDLGFTDADRVENIRRVAEVMRLMVDAGLIVMVSFISPFRSERRMARYLILYKKARRGELQHFTGIDSPYDEPQHPEIRIETMSTSPDEAVERIVRKLAGSGFLSGEL